MEDWGFTDLPDQLEPKKNVGAELTLSWGLSRARNRKEKGFFNKTHSFSNNLTLAVTNDIIVTTFE